MSSNPSPDEIIEKLKHMKNLSPGTDKRDRSFILNQLDHEEARVREVAVSCIWDVPDRDVADTVLEMARNDPSEGVRVQAIRSLGIYMREGEMERFESDDGPIKDGLTELSMTEDQYERMRDFLIETFRDNEEVTLEERRRALESLSFLYREDVTGMIEEAYQHDEKKMKVSALLAMSRRKQQKWRDEILESLNSADEEIQHQALAAAGECSIEDAHQPLKSLATSIEDREVFREAVMALAMLGLQKTFSFLDNLDVETRINVDREFAESAMEEWRFKNNVRQDMQEK